MLSLVSFVGMTLDKCIDLQIGTLSGGPLCRESHLLCRLKNPNPRLNDTVGLDCTVGLVCSCISSNVNELYNTRCGLMDQRFGGCRSGVSSLKRPVASM